MPPGKEGVVIIGSSQTTILRFAVAFPTEFVALTVKLNVPVSVSMPEIAPVDAFRFKPVGSVPVLITQFIGVVPVAASFWL